MPAKPGVAYKVRFITTKRGVKVDPVKTVDIPAKGGKGTARRVPVYSDGIGAVAKTVTFGKGEPVFASYRLADDDLYVRARVESDEATTYPYAQDRMHPLVKVAWAQPYRR